MAGLCGRFMLSAARRPMAFTSVRTFFNKEMNDPLDHATGVEKRELLANLAGNDDPFHMKPIKRGPSTKDKPTLVPSAFEARIIGCICHEDQTHVQWMWLHQGIPKRCECGSWYKLFQVEPL